MSEHTHDHHEHGNLEGVCHPKEKRIDFLYYGSLILVIIAYGLHLFGVFENNPKVAHFNHQVFELMNDMWWGVVISIFAIGFLSQVPRERVMTYFSARTRVGKLAKATIAGMLFDLCNHGVLILGMKIYERGATLGQTMAFLISSPWNSFSLTMIMYTLIGGVLTIKFLLLSLVVAFISGWLFDELVKYKILPGNHHVFQPAQTTETHIPMEFSFKFFKKITLAGFADSRMILKWIFVGTLLSAFVGVVMTPAAFTDYFGATLRGAFLTLFGATGLEICSQGSIPLAADLVNVAHAPGNAFIFLMAGVATNLTEILVIRQTMKSWKVALFVPLVTLPQIMILGILLN